MPDNIQNLVDIHKLARLPDTDAVRRTGNAYALNDSGKICGLSLSGSQIKSLVLDESADALVHLYLNDNKDLREVRFALPLPKLRLLYLSRCALTSFGLPPGYMALEQLYLQDNQLTALTFQGDCPALALLDASKNKLTDFRLPAGFGKLAYLYLRENEIEGLDIVQILPLLNTLDLDKNGIKYLPDSIKNQIIDADAALEALYLGGNVPKDIPKFFLGNGGMYSKKNCIEDASIWFRELKDNESEQNKVVKLMLTGNGNAGKSTLLCALQNGACTCKPDHKTTHGIQIATIEKAGIAYNVWDFGGQEVYHGTHRLFMESEALQVILFDPETETLARDGKRVQDRANEEQVLHHQMAYWFSTTKELSPGSRFFIVQNKKDMLPQVDKEIEKFAGAEGAKFLHVGAKTGQDLDELEFYLKKEAQTLPEFEMWMPASWIKVRQFFIDNLKKEKESIKLLEKNEFLQLCADHGVSEKSRPLLLEYLHHSGFLYRHSNLGGQIIADQSWALEAIYKPLDREKDHYQEFRNYKGLIRLNRLFQVFGDSYTVEQKWLFLSFMESCGLCFQLNNKPWQETRDLSDLYVFPEFLRPEKPQDVVDLWKRAKEVYTLRYQFPWINYFVIQSFIATLGRKTKTENIWRYGIHVQTEEGWFKVELDYDQKALVLSIENSAINHWLKSIIEAIPLKRDLGKWEIAGPDGHFSDFDFENWQKQQKEKMGEERMRGELEGENETIEKRLEDKFQQLDRQVILFLSASPAAKKISCGEEFMHIYYGIEEYRKRGICEVEVQLNITSDEMSNVIRKYTPTIVHYCGHGEEVNPDNPRSKGLLFMSDDHTGTKVMDSLMLEKIFASIKERNPRLEVVLLNACYTEPQAAAISKHNIFAIGTSEQIGSLAARKFAVGFYTEYFRKKDVKAGIRFGKEKGTTENIDIDKLIDLFYHGEKINI